MAKKTKNVEPSERTIYEQIDTLPDGTRVRSTLTVRSPEPAPSQSIQWDDTVDYPYLMLTVELLDSPEYLYISRIPGHWCMCRGDEVYRVIRSEFREALSRCREWHREALDALRAQAADRVGRERERERRVAQWYADMEGVLLAGIRL